jgi:molecular chaperone GrpE (heat shock protein)
MSDPKRYSRRDIYDVTYQAAGDECLPEPSENGEYVLWEDYARLKAEVERLTKQREKLIESAEVLFRFIGEELYGPIDHFEAAWNAAKDGKPTE